jgi:hypothetical protein
MKRKNFGRTGEYDGMSESRNTRSGEDHNYQFNVSIFSEIYF